MPEGIEWGSSAYGRFFALIQDEFPLIEPASGQFVRMRYRHQSKPLLLQLSESILTINLLPKYPGWKQMQSEILTAWTQLKQIAAPAQVTRIGLRYINLIPVIDDDTRLSDWFATNQYVASSVLSARPSASQIDIQIDQDVRAIVRVGEATDESDINARKFALDIDTIYTVGQDKLIQLTETIDLLHNKYVWQIFDSFRTPKLDDFLNEE